MAHLTPPSSRVTGILLVCQEAQTHPLSPHPQVRGGKHWHFPTLGSSDWHHLSGSEPGATASQEERSECFICTSHYICPFSGHNTTQSYGTALSEPLSGLTAVYFCSMNLRVWDQACVQCFDLSRYNMYILVLYSYFNSAPKPNNNVCLGVYFVYTCSLV